MSKTKGWGEVYKYISTSLVSIGLFCNFITVYGWLIKYFQDPYSGVASGLSFKDIGPYSNPKMYYRSDEGVAVYYNRLIVYLVELTITPVIR